jgi:hypothetical protein
MPEEEIPRAPDQKGHEPGNDWIADSIREAIVACPDASTAGKILSEQLREVAAERPLKSSELSTLAQTLIATLGESPTKESAI